jgi:hypothetical protein
VLVMRAGRLAGHYVPFRSSESELMAAVNA